MFAFGLRRRCNQLGPLAAQPRCFPLKLGQPRQLHQILGIEIAHAVQFTLNQDKFLTFCSLLRLDAGDFLVRLRHALLQLRFLTGAFGAAQLEQFALAAHRRNGVGIVGARQKRGWERDLVGAIALGLETRLTSG